MFTGIIETTAKIAEKNDTGLVIERPANFDDIRTGSSVAVNGVCLTVVKFMNSAMAFDVVPETWSKTNLGDLHPGDFVNLERALPASGRFEGHVVQGHVEGTGTVRSFKRRASSEEGAMLTIEFPRELFPFILPKGSITMDGVSLTVASVEGSQCTVALIPETLRRTTLGTLETGGRVNIETDILGRYLKTFLDSRL